MNTLKDTTSGPHQFYLHFYISPCRSIRVACSIGKVYTIRGQHPLVTTITIATSANTSISRTDEDRISDDSPRIMRTDRRTDDPEIVIGTCVSCWRCRKSFKTVKGLRIHQTRKGCRYEAGGRQVPTDGLQRAAGIDPADKAPDNSRLESNHSVAAESTADETNDRRPPIMWPAMSDLKAWSEMNDDLTKVLNAELKGDVVQKLQKMSHIIYSYGIERFGCKEVKEKPEKPGLSRRQLAIHNIRTQLREISKQWRVANNNRDVVQMEGLDEIREELRTKLKSLRKAERIKTRERRRRKKGRNFSRIPSNSPRTCLTRLVVET